MHSFKLPFYNSIIFNIIYVPLHLLPLKNAMLDFIWIGSQGCEFESDLGQAYFNLFACFALLTAQPSPYN